MLCFSVSSVAGSTGEIDLTVVVTWVVDGDTIDVASGETIRLADIDTPEKDTPGYSEATQFMIDLVKGKQVYLDVDDITRTDSSGQRLVCVVYVDYNSTHYENVNKALLEGGYAVVWDHDNNEFEPSNWSLYVLKATIPEFPAVSLLAVIVVIILFATLLCRKRQIKKHD